MSVTENAAGLAKQIKNLAAVLKAANAATTMRVNATCIDCPNPTKILAKAGYVRIKAPVIAAFGDSVWQHPEPSDKIPAIVNVEMGLIYITGMRAMAFDLPDLFKVVDGVAVIKKRDFAAAEAHLASLGFKYNVKGDTMRLKDKAATVSVVMEESGSEYYAIFEALA